ncbi:hypothetical protein [Turicibacter sanguinis]|uniref:hypothetical protein n=2 Tax=Turicibacter sanguinis TaxID=154288 RepID=UPI0018AA069A|nr:hypothetical protein [Turicibacter sanguinis]
MENVEIINESIEGELVQEIPEMSAVPEFMTIFYRKKTGEIKELMSDLCDMSVFGEEQEDYEQIWDYIHVPVDDMVRNHKDQFSVDLDTKELIYTPLIDTSKYRMR